MWEGAQSGIKGQCLGWYIMFSAVFRELAISSLYYLENSWPLKEVGCYRAVANSGCSTAILLKCASACFTVLPDTQFWVESWLQHQHGASPEEIWFDFLELLPERLCSGYNKHKHVRLTTGYLPHRFTHWAHNHRAVIECLNSAQQNQKSKKQYLTEGKRRETLDWLVTTYNTILDQLESSDRVTEWLIARLIDWLIDEQRSKWFLTTNRELTLTRNVVVTHHWGVYT